MAPVAKHVIGALTLVGSITLIGHLRLRAIEARIGRAPTARIGVVQGDLDPSRKETRDPVAIYRGASLELLRREPELDLLIWPEEAIYYPVRSSSAAAFLREKVWRGPGGVDNGHLEVPLLIGMLLAHDPDPETQHDRRTAIPLTNSAILTTRSGRIVGRYDKRQLVPIGEVSIVPRWLRSKSGDTPEQEYVAGTGDTTLTFGTHRLGISICYEDILHQQFRAAVVQSDPDLLVNLTADNWFQHSPGSGLHLTLAQLRAIEHRKFLLRATETGTTSLISPTGRVTWSLPVDRRSSGIVTTHWLHGTTVYGRIGDWPWCLAVGLLVWTLFARPRTVSHPTRGQT
jgi:apolipoprotein N-acyltransferase